VNTGGERQVHRRSPARVSDSVSPLDKAWAPQPGGAALHAPVYFGSVSTPILQPRWARAPLPRPAPDTAHHPDKPPKGAE